ncbi:MULTISPECIES: inovirus Gp2 family protein [Pseudomonas]|uniref:inovirus Gp2 family protein n=1 Tax=Pseudomonas TaxID=286 RepID=UPI0005B8E8F9|nr:MULTISPECIES: inovirus Gp2 family protein [Pseudomonas]KWR71944.1 transposase [Pseudomonas sp. PI1]MCO2197061.1 inovirus Gp2 family protein [Pseudomonas aeruginosa]MCO2655716.1 inovirus Gp2 family protein [Pseudomonas aeruginosa]OBY93339.1 transposase [Pseudomonas sp. AU11447]HBO3179818.1 inovirus Gp2 family protein [Pseudomonas aeruginosa]
MLHQLDTASHHLLRHPGNTNLHLYRQPTYRGLPLMIDKGPFVEEYLSRLLRVIQRALTQYPRVMAFRVDLNLPRDIDPSEYADANKVISRFIASFSAKIEYHRSQLREEKKDARDCRVRYAWAREVGMGGRPHYHLVFLLNRDAYHRPGRVQSTRRNLVARLQEAWASALQLSVDQVDGLVHITDNATYRIYQNVPDGKLDELPELFRRASYLCKAATKSYGSRLRGFDTSKG